MTTGDRIKARRKDLGLSADNLAESLGISRATVFRYERGDIEKIPSTILKPLATLLHVTPAYLMGWEQSSDKQTTLSEVRFLGSVAAGYNYLANEEFKYLKVPTEWLHHRPATEYAALRVTGASMFPEYREGDQVLIHLQSAMDRSGQVGVFLYADGQTTLKKIEYLSGEDWIDLVPLNPAYETKRISGIDLDQCRVLGKVVQLIRNISQ